MPFEKETMMGRVTAAKRGFIEQVRLVEEESEPVLQLTVSEAALAWGFPREFWQNLKGKALQAVVDEEGKTVTLKLTPATTSETTGQKIGQELWRDLVEGFRSGQKEVSHWRKAYNFLYLVLSAGYQEKTKGLTQILQQAETWKILDPQISEINSFGKIYDQLKRGGDLAGLDLELGDLHVAAAGIFYGILPPGTQEELKAQGLAPENLGSAVSR